MDLVLACDSLTGFRGIDAEPLFLRGDLLDAGVARVLLVRGGFASSFVRHGAGRAVHLGDKAVDDFYRDWVVLMSLVVVVVDKTFEVNRGNKKVCEC